VVQRVERELLTPVGLRSLAPGDPDYKARYRGSPFERDSAYHQGTVWPWLMGAYIDAYLEAFGRTEEALHHCRLLIERLEAEMSRYGLGSLAEVYDGEAPHNPGGCPMQAWSVAELIRVKHNVLRYRPDETRNSALACGNAGGTA
jgi:glycogen debranching enzyme